MNAEKKDRLAEVNTKFIIEAAEELFLERGFDAVTITDICAKGDLSRSTLYKYFLSKDDVLNAIILAGMQEAGAAVRAAARTERSYIDRYYDVCFAVAEYSQNKPYRYECVSGGIALRDTDDKNIIRRIGQAGNDINETLLAFFNEGIAVKVLKEDVLLPASVFTFWGCLIGITRVANQDDAVIRKSMGIGQREFQRTSFTRLLRAFQ